MDAQPDFFKAAARPVAACAVVGVGGAVGGAALVGRGVCCVTGGAARYWDPVACAPYADLAAFRALRRKLGLPTAPARRL